MIAIGTGKSGIDWQKIEAEYVGGSLSLRLIGEKYGIPWGTIQDRASRGKWGQKRRTAREKAVEKAVQETADIFADNAKLAERIKAKLLRKLEKEIDALPEYIGSGRMESDSDRKYKGGNLIKVKDTVTNYKLKDLTAAYKDLTGDMVQKDEQGNELLESLLTLERRATNGD